MTPLLILAAAAVGAPAPDDIVVLGERMRKFRFNVRQDQKTGTLTCKIKRKSGDAALDAAMCEEAKVCVGQNDGTKLDLDAFQSCLEQRFEQVRLARLAANARVQ